MTTTQIQLVPTQTVQMQYTAIYIEARQTPLLSLDHYGLPVPILAQPHVQKVPISYLPTPP